MVPATVSILAEIRDERLRQVEAEGWTPEHDDQHVDGEMAYAASRYAEHASMPDHIRRRRETSRAVDTRWPWGARWFKPKTRRRDLVIAAALLVAEIERLDRAAAKAESGS